jgi:hypothetical protein
LPFFLVFILIPFKELLILVVLVVVFCLLFLVFLLFLLFLRGRRHFFYECGDL